MSSEREPIEQEEHDSGGMVLIGIGISALILAVAAIVYVRYGFSGGVTESGAANYGLLGSIGDWWGGVANPVLAFVAFIALLYTIQLQRTELRLTRQELRASRLAQEASAKALKASQEQSLDILKVQRADVLMKIVQHHSNLLSLKVEGLKFEHAKTKTGGSDAAAEKVARFERFLSNAESNIIRDQVYELVDLPKGFQPFEEPSK